MSESTSFLSHVFRRRISGLNASRELPSSTEEALLLWVNKTCQAFAWKRHAAVRGMLKEPQLGHKKLNRLNLLEEDVTLPRARRLGEAVGDGQHLAAVLLHYAPQSLSWDGKFMVFCA